MSVRMQKTGKEKLKESNNREVKIMPAGAPRMQEIGQLEGVTGE